jgi:hypothetical protein
MNLSALARKATCTLKMLIATGAAQRVRLDTVDDLINATRRLVILGLLVTGHTDDGLYLEASIPGLRLRIVKNLFFGRVTYGGLHVPALVAQAQVFDSSFYDCLLRVEGKGVSTRDLERTKLPAWQRVSYDRPPAEVEAEARERLQLAIPRLRLWAWRRLFSRPVYAVLLLCATAMGAPESRPISRRPPGS